MERSAIRGMLFRMLELPLPDDATARAVASSGLRRCRPQRALAPVSKMAAGKAPRRVSSPPQLLRGELRTLRQGLELRPHDAGVDPAVHRALGEAAVGAGDDVLAADQTGEPHDPLAHQFGVFD